MVTKWCREKEIEDLENLQKELKHSVEEIKDKKKQLRDDWEYVKAMDRSYL